MPTDQDEAWRRTSLKGLVRSKYQLQSGDTDFRIPTELTNPLAGEDQDGKVFIQPGKSEQELKPEYVNQGVVFDTFANALLQKPELVQLLGSIVQADEGKFAALTTAMAQDGVILFVPKGVKILNPLHSILWGAGNLQAVFSRVFHLVGRRCSGNLCARIRLVRSGKRRYIPFRFG